MPPAISVNGQILTQSLSGSGYVIKDRTIFPGSSAVIIDQTPYSLAPSASALVFGSSTFPLATAAASASKSGPISPLIAGTKTSTPLSPSVVEIEGLTLSLNGPPTSDSKGTLLSLGPSGIAIGSSMYAFPTPAPATHATDTITSPLFAASMLVVAGQTFTLQSSQAVVVDSATLTASGSGITVSGKPVSVSSRGLVVGAKTVASFTTTGLVAGNVVTMNGETFTVEGDGAVLVGSHWATTTASGIPANTGTHGSVVANTTDSLHVPPVDPSAPGNNGNLESGSCKLSKAGFR